MPEIQSRDLEVVRQHARLLPANDRKFTLSHADSGLPLCVSVLVAKLAAPVDQPT